MTDVQLVSIVLTLLAIFGSILYNRKGNEDMRDLLRAEIRATGAEIRGELKTDSANLRTEMVSGFSTVNQALQRIENKLDHLTETLANHAERIERLEKRG
jgi:hypothetical protein